MTGETQNHVFPIISTQPVANGSNELSALMKVFSDAFPVLGVQSGQCCDNPRGVGGAREIMENLSRTPTPPPEGRGLPTSPKLFR